MLLLEQADLHFLSCDKPDAFNSRQTELTTKDETSETTVRNLYCLVPNSSFPSAVNLFSSVLNHIISYFKTIFQAEDLI